MDWIQIVLFVLIMVLIIKPLGLYIQKVLDPYAETFLDRIFRPLEHSIYRVCGIDPRKEQTWTEYLFAVLGFSLVSFFLTASILSLQAYLPLNPQKLGAPSWHLNFNTAMSFVTNTDWQSYAGETTMSYFSQMAALTVQNFVSPAVGIAVAAVLTRGISRKSVVTLGNFWTDLVRSTLYLLLPIALAAALFFVAQGVPQNFSPYVEATTLEGGTQLIAQGPIASQESIKLLGTNGGGFFNANSAHPYENPTPLSNLVQMVLILAIPVAQFYYFGCEVRDRLHSWYILVALSIIFLGGAISSVCFERSSNPEWEIQKWTGANWEGKEQRFGIGASSLYSCLTTAASCGSVNCTHDSLTPLGGMVPLVNMKLDSVIFGGVGSGLYSALLMVILSVFISGLMIGRMPEYLGNKISPFDIKMVVCAILAYATTVYVFSALACCSNWGLQGLGNSGPHGLTEIFYAYTSCVANNGSAFAGLSANAAMYNITLALAMLSGRFFVIIPVLALAGSLVHKKMHEKTAGSFPVATLLFSLLFIGIIVIMGALTFVPCLILGPVIEQFFMIKGVFFP